MIDGDALNNAEKKARLVSAELERLYPDAECSLEWKKGEQWQLLVMGRLSAQCTDAKVNTVCRELFSVFPSPRALADGDIEEIERIIRPCGLYHSKAESIKECCRLLVTKYGGKIPASEEELLSMPGIGRKIANLLLGDIYGIPGIVADTHCIRICGRLGFYDSSSKNPRLTERVMSALLEPNEQSAFCHRMVLFGREYCSAQRPACDKCPLGELCTYNK